MDGVGDGGDEDASSFSSTVDQLSTASATGNLADVQRLLAAATEVNGRNEFGRTALQVMNMSRSEIARTLLHAGAMVNTQDTSYRTHGIDTLRTPCHDAAELGYKETVRVLVEHGAVITMQDNQGNTPAHLAAKSGNFDTMKYLSRALPVSSLKNHKGETILDLYQTHGILSRARKRWIERERSTPMSLQRMACIRVREALGEVGLRYLSMANKGKPGVPEELGQLPKGVIEYSLLQHEHI